ncbi:MAG: FlgD immunoglobulin-like domain containing protein [bacterium]|nr:FlgD immunoglobulin-like domain containing protein [bacterium]
MENKLNKYKLFIAALIILLLPNIIQAQPGVNDYAYERGILYHSDGSKCSHLPPDVSFIVLLNNNDSKILTEQCPRWAPGADPNINGRGMYGVELGNFTDPEITVADSFTIIFNCNTTLEQGQYSNEIITLPYNGLNFRFELSPNSYLPPVTDLKAELKNSSVDLGWTASPNLTYLIYRRDLSDILSDGRARYQYQKIAEVNENSTYQDTSTELNHYYGYLVISKNADGLISARSQEVSAMPAIAILPARPRNTTVELKWLPAENIGITIAGYNLYRRVEGSEFPVLPTTFLDLDTFYTDTRLTPNTTYYYQLRSRDIEGNELNYSEEISATTDNQPQNYVKFAGLEILIVIYTNTSRGSIQSNEIPKIKKMLEKARLFYWRNSGLKMNLDFSYLLIEDYINVNPDDYSTDGVQADLYAHGIKDLQYDAVFRISPATNGFWSWGVTDWDFMGPANSTGFSSVVWPTGIGAPYPIYEPGINYGLTWFFTHEFQHAMDDIYYENSHYEMYHGDNPCDFPVACGEEFDFQAKMYRDFQAWLDLDGHWGQILESEDIDNDGIPDNDPRVPLDELRFGSDSLKLDTDNDGLSDYLEITAGIYEGTNPAITDTDGDGLSDNEDKYPLYPVHTEIPRFTPVLNGDIEDGWHLLIDRLNFSATSFDCKIYLNWDTDYLYIAFNMNTYAVPSIFIDATADGWWYFRDNYRLSFFPHTGTLREARVLDCTPEARNYNQSLGQGKNPMWDNNSNYISEFGRIINSSDFQIYSKTTTSGYTIEMTIPRNTRSGLTLSEGDSIGLRFLFEKLENSSWNKWATAFEQYSFVNVKLVKSTDIEDQTTKHNVPDIFSLEQNYPNPFNSETTISYHLPKAAQTQLIIYNLVGQKVKILVDNKQLAGIHTIQWDGKNDFGQDCSSGVYLLMMNASEYRSNRKLIMLR